MSFNKTSILQNQSCRQTVSIHMNVNIGINFRVWHNGLLFKLRQNGIDGNLLEWLNSYLSQRKQKVCFKACYSCLKFIFAGVPQGSVLGPLLFLVYINDIAKQRLSLTKLFADDSSLFYAAANIADIAGIINHDLQLLSN